MSLHPVRSALVATTVFLCACPGRPATPPTPPVADSTALRAQADSLAAARRRDSVLAASRADSLARFRADSVARTLAAHRADSVRAQVLRDSADTGGRMASGLRPVDDSLIAAAVHFDLDRS